MEEKFVKKTAVLAVIILFLSLAATPAINAVNTKEQSNDEYELLIITPIIYIRALKPLVNHKNSVGVPTKLVTLNEVYKQTRTQGRDKPEQIKYYIKYAIETWGIKYVLLIGNFRQMPIRYCWNDEPWTGFTEPNFISELYYADIYDQNGDFSSWNLNDNNKFGEWKGDEAQDKDIDLYPDVYVGRLACRTCLELKATVNKIIKYETTTYGQEWFNTMVVAAGDTYPPGSYDFETPLFEGEENTAHAMENMTGFEFVKLWTSDGTLTGPNNVTNAVNSGCGILLFDGHANPSTWGTHPPNDKKNFTTGLSLSDMNKLKNKDMLPVCVVGGCHNLQFDVALTNYLKNPKETFYRSTGLLECWGWKLTHMASGGSIATIGNTGLGMSKEDKTTREGAGDFLDVQFFYEYGTNGTHVLGEVWGKAITNYLNNFPINWSTKAGWDYSYDAKTVQQWVILGDPSLMIGGYPPEE